MTDDDDAGGTDVKVEIFIQMYCEKTEHKMSKSDFLLCVVMLLDPLFVAIKFGL